VLNIYTDHDGVTKLCAVKTSRSKDPNSQTSAWVAGGTHIVSSISAAGSLFWLFYQFFGCNVGVLRVKCHFYFIRCMHFRWLIKMSPVFRVIGCRQNDQNYQTFKL